MSDVVDSNFKAWLEWMKSLVREAWERRKEAEKPSGQFYWSWVIRKLKEDIEYEKERRSGRRGPPVLFRF